VVALRDEFFVEEVIDSIPIMASPANISLIANVTFSSAAAVRDARKLHDGEHSSPMLMPSKMQLSDGYNLEA
jgi:hypothetical protein